MNSYELPSSTCVKSKLDLFLLQQTKLFFTKRRKLDQHNTGTMLQEGSTVRLKVGISSCLMGDEVRFDGGHKRSAFATDELTRHIDLVRFCPEVGIGMPVPRPTIRLEKHANDGSETVEAVVPKTGEIVQTPEKKTIHFKMTKELFNKLNNNE